MSKSCIVWDGHLSEFYESGGFLRFMYNNAPWGLWTYCSCSAASLSSLWLLFYRLNSFNLSYTFIVFAGPGLPSFWPPECLMFAIWARKSNDLWVPFMLSSLLTSWPLGYLGLCGCDSSMSRAYLLMSLYVFETADCLSKLDSLTFCSLLCALRFLKISSHSSFDLLIRLAA